MKNDVAGYEIVTRWRGGMASESNCRENRVDGQPQSSVQHVIYADEPQALGGKNSAPSPQELLLAAFNACMTAVFAGVAQREGIALSRLEIQTTGNFRLTPYESLPFVENEMPDSVRYLIRVSGDGSIAQFDNIHRSVIATSPTRGILAQNMTVEGDMVVESHLTTG
ncbi:MAG TPA: OsmC family protein [Scandinavium sp.]|jgi:uncharacterized OsmC-like protein|uniref:OsmC family protein n=1 Tax=Scandinavium sp. TaxID=2830653 RepID=UPI002E35B51B|nr:OsmC family protein [Scandinavium sp.]HEX4501930.1 OsmC family protein [Scandinavium sp.]